MTYFGCQAWFIRRYWNGRIWGSTYHFCLRWGFTTEIIRTKLHCMPTSYCASHVCHTADSTGPWGRDIGNLGSRGQLKCDGTRAETRFRLSAKRTSPFKSEGALVQSTTGSRGVRISGSNAGYTMFRGNVKGTGYPLHSPVFPSLPLPCVTVCHHISTGV